MRTYPSAVVEVRDQKEVEVEGAEQDSPSSVAIHHKVHYRYAAVQMVDSLKDAAAV